MNKKVPKLNFSNKKPPSIKLPELNNKELSPFRYKTIERKKSSEKNKTLSTFSSITKPSTESFRKIKLKQKKIFSLSPINSNKHKFTPSLTTQKKKYKGYNFNFPLSNLCNSKSSTELITSIIQLNKKLFQSSIYKGKKEIPYSKKDFEIVKDYIQNKEVEYEVKSEELIKDFDQRKKSRVGDNIFLSPPVKKQSFCKGISQDEFENFKRKQLQCLTQRTERKSISFAKQMFNVIQTQPKEKEEEKEIIEDPILSKMKKNESTVNIGILKKKIKIYNLMQSGNNRNALDEVNLKDDLGEDFCFGSTSFKFNLKPNFLKTKFKKITLKKFEGIDGKFFGVPV